MKDTRSHRPFGHTDDGGDVGARPLFDFAEDDGDTLFERQPIERQHQPPSELSPLCVTMRIVRTARLGLPREPSECRSAACRRSDVVLCVVHSDRHEKCAKRAFPAKPGDRSRQGYEHILNEILRRLDIPHQPLRKRTNRHVMLVVNQRNRRRICALQPSNQRVRGVLVPNCVCALAMHRVGHSSQIHLLRPVRNRSSENRSILLWSLERIELSPGHDERFRLRENPSMRSQIQKSPAANVGWLRSKQGPIA